MVNKNGDPYKRVSVDEDLNFGGSGKGTQFYFVENVKDSGVKKFFKEAIEIGNNIHK